ncbi:MAG: VCBS repeat-containing protein [Bacteroidota bacterium]
MCRFSSCFPSFFSLLCLGNLLAVGMMSGYAQAPLFSLLPSEKTGIVFENPIIENEQINILTYEYFHNGGGVAIGDLNNDGLADLYFTGNLSPNQMYLNQGNWQFKDVTETAGVGGSQGWNTGVTMVDINHDGWLDLYVCLSGNVPEAFRANQLYVNNQDGTFSEEAKKYGVDDTGYATQAAFLDYDLDGDLDLFILNHNIFPINDFKPSEVRKIHDSNVGDKLYENQGGKYVDISQQAGLHTNPLGYGLGVAVGDINQDGYPDLYVTNDFLEHDYCYLNKGDGTFTDIVKSAFNQTSQFSMGTDMADFNNDGLVDILSVDMVAEDNYRQKTTMRPMDRTQFYYAVEDGFHYQYMHNALQLNRGDLHFSNISKLAGVSNTDWSWAPLFADLDLDGWKDIVITNGYKKDISNKDYVKFEQKKLAEFRQGKITNAELFRELLTAAPITKIQNYVFRNEGGYTFEKMNEAWNFAEKGFSNGMAYGDLDNDGDLDVVINNIDQEAFVYQNHAREQAGNNYLTIRLDGPPNNPFGLGAKVEVQTAEGPQYLEAYQSRGFQSSVDPRLSVGLGTASQAQQIVVRWFDGTETIAKKVKANREIVLSYDKAKSPKDRNAKSEAQDQGFRDVTKTEGLKVVHQENAFDDFAYEVLLPHKMSQWGPALATGDLNGDQLDDFFLGGAAGFPGQVHLQKPSGKFELLPQPTFSKHVPAEDVGAVFFDADQDGDLDVYVVSGGNEFAAGSRWYQDRLYRNDGSGNLQLDESALPSMTGSGGVVKPLDFDQDGDLDLFVSGRMLPRAYPSPANSVLLQNDQGSFRAVTEALAPELNQLGMVTDALASDIDQDGDVDLLLSGEWMAPTIFQFDQGTFQRLSVPELDQKVGWGFSLGEGDIDGDGDPDYVLGNLGTNYKYKASKVEPFQVYLNDFDDNGTQDIVLSYVDEGVLYPLRGRQCSSEQMPFITEKFKTYDLFAKADLPEIYGEESLNTSLHYQATDFRSMYLENLGEMTFALHPLPIEAQFSAISTIWTGDLNGDQNLDVVVAGNLVASEVETPRNDAGVGLLLLGNGEGDFEAVDPHESGLYLPYDVKHLAQIRTASGGIRFIVACNQDAVRMLEWGSQ